MEGSVLAARFVVALVLLLAGAAKVRRTDEFARAVDGYKILPRTLVRPVAATLPWLELGCGLTLAVGVATRIVATVTVVLLAVFTAAMGIALLRGMRIDCGCFGATTSGRASGWTVARNVLLIFVALAVVARPPTTLAAWPAAAGLPGTDGLAVLVAVTAFYLSGVLA